ncbi:MAG TPA: TolC family protein [Kofleriaceae bacterium]|nr:TolC family protein [Kofleriaceae bacterium]
MRACLAGVVAIISVAHTVRADDGSLTLEQAVQLALAHNERAGIAELNVEVAIGGVDKARVAFLPVLAAAGNNQYSPWDKSPHDVTKGSLTLSQPLIAPSAFPLYDQAKNTLEGERAQTADDKRQLAFDTAKAYLAVLLADQVVQAAQKKLETAKAEVKATDAQFKAKIVSSNDTTRAAIDLANSQHEVSADQGSLDASYVSLDFLIAGKASRPLVVPQQLLAASEQPVGNVEQIVAASIKARPDLAAKKSLAVAAHDFAREPRYRFFPTLGVAATMNAQSTKLQSDNYYLDGSVALTASWTIYDAGSRAADARTRDAQAAIADLTADMLAREVDEQVRAAVVQLAASQAALVAARDAMTQAQKSATEEAILYSQGLATALELVDANESRFLAEVQFAEDQYSLANTYLALLQAMGKGPLDPETP